MKFTDFFRDDAPYSSLRLLQFIFFLLFSIGWIFVTLRTKLMADIPIGLQVVVGLFLGGKVLQKGIEVYQARVTPASAPAPETKTAQGGFVRLPLVLFLLILSAVIFTTSMIHAETREEMKTRFKAISVHCAEAVRVNPSDPQWDPAFQLEHRQHLLDDLIRCATERNHLRRAAACPHNWHVLGPKAKGCPRCKSIAHLVDEKWLVVLADGIWVGPEPLCYPEDYGLTK